MADYRNLEVWQKAMELTMMIYDAADTFPNHERYRLVSQMERAAVSIPSNIAEGYGRQSDKEFYHFLSIARGSLYELQTQVYIVASGRSYMSEEWTNKINQWLDQLGRMIYGFMKRLENANPSIRRKPAAGSRWLTACNSTFSDDINT